MASVLGRIGQGLVSFGTGTPQIELDRQAAQNQLINTQSQIGQQSIATDQAALAKDQQIQQLSTIAFDEANPDKDKALRRLFQLDDTLALNIQKGLRLEDQAGLEGAARRAAAIQAQPTKELRDAEVRKQVIDNPTLDLSETAQLLDMSFEEQETPLRVTQQAALSAKERSSAASGGTSKLGQSVVTKGPGGELSFATPVLGPSGQVQTQQTPISGKIVSRQAGETSLERQTRDIQTEGGKTTARAVSTRDQNFIDVGQRQADASAVVRRGLQLLETVGTGRPEAIALAAKNLFGIAGADETELNANLGKAILSQLRETFGAQFTENEGKRLESIESNFGKSTAGNKRLLQQTLKSMERDARRGIDAARRNEDQFSIDEIDKALQFTFDPAATDDAGGMSDEDLKKALGL